jgi:hypothetical protein
MSYRHFGFVVRHAFLAFLLSLASGADQLPLGDLPWTCANRIWTASRRRLPSINRNQLGHAISVGGQIYEQGIVGHTGMSLVYNLSGKAKSLTLAVGIEDEDPPQFAGRKLPPANALVVFQTDRREVLRQEVKWGSPPVPVTIDLTGKQQLEIRADYGKKGFLRQRVALLAPIVTTDHQTELLATAKEWRQRLDVQRLRKPLYPDAPANWRGIMAERQDFKGFANSYRFTTASMELIVVPECGGRIYSIKRSGERNILRCQLDGAKWKLPEYGNQVYTGGFYTQPQPRNYFLPPDPFLGFGAYEISFPSEGEILLTSPPSWIFFLRFQYHLKINPDQAELEIVSTHVNLAPFPQLAGIWSLTTVNRKQLASVDIPAESARAPRKTSFEKEKYRSWLQSDKDWVSLRLPENNWNLMGPNDCVQWQVFPQKNLIKAVCGHTTYRKSFDVPENVWNDMGSFYPAHVFVGDKIGELECHGPTLLLNPRESVQLRETWRLTP